MAGNAHASRQRKRPSKNHKPGCLMCTVRPPQGKAKRLFRNSTGHRHNPGK